MPKPMPFRRKTLAILKNARNLISRPEWWTRGVLAQNQYGQATFYRAENACKWCMAGAILREQMVWPEAGSEALHIIASIAQKRMPSASPDAAQMTIADFNDFPGRDHAQVMAVFDLAITTLQNQERNK